MSRVVPGMQLWVSPDRNIRNSVQPSVVESQREVLKPGFNLLVSAVLLLLGCQGSPPTTPSMAPIKAQTLVLECKAGSSATTSNEASVIGTRSVALLLFRDATVDVATLRPPAEYETMLFTDGRLVFEAWSLGKASLTGKVFGWYPVTDLAHRSKTELNALAAGYSPSWFDITGYVVTSYSGGVAVIRHGKGDFTVGASDGTGLILHELMHVCGIGHANKCVDQKKFPASPVKPYGDSHSIMGSNIFGEIAGLYPTAMHREMLGWITVPIADSSGETKDFLLRPYETTGDALKIPRGRGDWFYIERRADGLHVCTVDPTDRTSGLWLPNLPIIDRVNGIEIHSIEGGVKVKWPAPLTERQPEDTFDQKSTAPEAKIPMTKKTYEESH